MIATVPHVTSGLGLKFQVDGFLLTRVYKAIVLNSLLLSSAMKMKAAGCSITYQTTHYNFSEES